MSVDRALAAYEAARGRLPPAGPGGRMERIADLGALAQRFDVFLLDAFGVLNVGEEAIAGVPERVAKLQGSGRRVMVLTNAASVSRTSLVEKYARLGYHFEPEDVVSSRDVVIDALGEAEVGSWGVMAPDLPREAAFGRLDLTLLEDDPEPYAAVEGVMLLGTATWTQERQQRLEAALRDRPRPVWVGNPDIVAPRGPGFSIEPGYYAHSLADRTTAPMRFFGKPFAEIFDLALARLGQGMDRRRVVMVGDSLHTDVLGAQTAGIASALVTGHGFLAGRCASDAVGATGLAPDFVLDTP